MGSERAAVLLTVYPKGRYSPRPKDRTAPPGRPQKVAGAPSSAQTFPPGLSASPEPRHHRAPGLPFLYSKTVGNPVRSGVNWTFAIL
jgi:hypothetical protein